MVKNNIAIDVKAMCIEAGISQAELAQEIGTTASYLSRMLKKNLVVNQTFVNMIEYLGYNIALTYEKKDSSNIFSKETISSLGEENEQKEFKKSTGELKDSIVSIVSILNKHGFGDLYFGVKNNGEIIGQETTDKTMRDISQAIGNHIRPIIYPEISKETYGDKKIIHVKFYGNNKPYTAYNIPRIRIADEDVVMNQDVYDEMIRKRDDFSKTWERQISDYNIHDIDIGIFKNYLKQAKDVGRIVFENEDVESVLTKLELLHGMNLLNAGAALFVDSGINDLQMAKFASNERITFTDLRRHTGSIIGLIEIAMRYIIDAMDWRVEFNGRVYRKEIPEIPVDAIREAVVNAFAHRQIESGQSVQIMIYRNRIEIYSPGKFPEKISPEEFTEGNQVAIRRNKLITQTLYYSKTMETFATGLKKIKTLCSNANVNYEFKNNPYGFTVVFYRHCGDGWGWSGEEQSISNPKFSYIPHYELEQDQEIIAQNIEKLISEDAKITRAQIADRLGISVRTVARKLKEMEHIQFEGSGKQGVWKIRKA